MGTQRPWLGMGLLVIASMSLGCPSKSGSGRAGGVQAPYEVSITGGCGAAKAATPDPATPLRDQDIEWELDANSAALTFKIEQKATATFPWPSGTKLRGGKGPSETAVGTASKLNRKPWGRHPYIVVFECSSGKVDTLDPTIIIPR